MSKPDFDIEQHEFTDEDIYAADILEDRIIIYALGEEIFLYKQDVEALMKAFNLPEQQPHWNNPSNPPPVTSWLKVHTKDTLALGTDPLKVKRLGYVTEGESRDVWSVEDIYGKPMEIKASKWAYA